MSSPCSPRDFQESSQAKQFESINSSALNLFYGPTPTSIHDYWKNHSFDNRDLFGKVMSLPFNTLSRFYSFSSREQASFKFMAVVTVHSDFGAQENKICHYFHFSPSICHEVMGTITPLMEPDTMILVF